MLITISLSAEDETPHWKALEETGFYGRAGAGALFYCTTTERYLLAHRSKGVEEPGTWGIIGGALNEGETPLQALHREIEEEAGQKVYGKPKLIYLFKSKSFRYFNYLVKVEHEFQPRINWEATEFKWFARNEFPEPLHFGVQKLIDERKI